MGYRLLKYEMEKRRLISGMSFVFGEQNYVENLVPFGPLGISEYFEVDSEILNAALAKNNFLSRGPNDTHKKCN